MIWRYQRKLEIARSYLRADSHELELGCGNGFTVIAHAPYAAQVEAVDIS